MRPSEIKVILAKIFLAKKQKQNCVIVKIKKKELEIAGVLVELGYIYGITNLRKKDNYVVHLKKNRCLSTIVWYKNKNFKVKDIENLRRLDPNMVGILATTKGYLSLKGCIDQRLGGSLLVLMI